jgi:cell fate regulator YaaT (PSP1 superfamily)
MKMDYIMNNETGRYTEKSYRRNSRHMLPVVDWLADLPEAAAKTNMVEVQFKNTRKGYYRNVNNLPLEKGVLVAVEGNPGHDVGEVTLVGQLVIMQMKKNRIDVDNFEARSIYRLATEADLQRAEEAHALEHETMIKARKIAKDMQLEMKIGDVEYQGDGGKAIFYYIADGRVDFRQLIKVYAETFRIRIEMKQIGARQEAGRIGGTGPCGRELCCSTWMTRFSSVGTGAARLQNLSPNPQKLAGQCAKLKCCLNYEIPTYEEAVSKLPDRRTPLETLTSTYYVFATDPLQGTVTYSTDPRQAVNLEIITAERAKAIIEMNRRGEKPDDLGGKHTTLEGSEVGYANVVGQDAVNRFDRHRGRDRQGHRPDRRDNRQDRPHNPSRDHQGDRRPRQDNNRNNEHK